jgi:hypothetical protein
VSAAANAVPVSFALAALAGADEAERLFPQAAIVVLDRSELRPARPLDGRLFEMLSALPAGSCIGLVVAVRVVSEARGDEAGTGGAGAEARPAPLFAVHDHVGLELRAPLTGRWPPGVPRSFPSMTARYQPAVVRSAGGARVYSGGVAAGVHDLARLTPFERVALRRAGCLAAADLLVPPAVVAAYYGHTLAACGVVQGPSIDEE